MDACSKAQSWCVSNPASCTLKNELSLDTQYVSDRSLWRAVPVKRFLVQVAEMEAKLQKLDAEREELAQYQAVDRECRSLEYAIHDKEVSDAGGKLEAVRFSCQFHLTPCPPDQGCLGFSRLFFMRLEPGVGKRLLVIKPGALLCFGRRQIVGHSTALASQIDCMVLV